MSPSENVVILVYQILSIQLKSLVLRTQTLPFLDVMFLALSLPAFGSFLQSKIQTNSATRKRQVSLDNYDIIMCKCRRRRSDPHVCITQDPEKELPVHQYTYFLKLQFQGECENVCFGDLNSLENPFYSV